MCVHGMDGLCRLHAIHTLHMYICTASRKYIDSEAGMICRMKHNDTEDSVTDSAGGKNSALVRGRYIMGGTLWRAHVRTLLIVFYYLYI